MEEGAIKEKAATYLGSKLLGLLTPRFTSATKIDDDLMMIYPQPKGVYFCLLNSIF